MDASEKLNLKILKKSSSKLIDLLGETFLPKLWKIKDAFSIVYSSAKDIAFQDFLEGMEYNFANNNLAEQDIEELYIQVEKNGNNELLTIILDSVFFSKSKMCRIVLGIIAGKYLNQNEMDYEDLTLAVALKDILDIDLSVFITLCERKPTENNLGDQTIFIGDYTSTQRIIVEKLQNLAVLGRDLAPNRLAGKGVSPLRYELTSVSKRLYEYIEVL